MQTSFMSINSKHRFMEMDDTGGQAFLWVCIYKSVIRKGAFEVLEIFKLDEGGHGEPRTIRVYVPEAYKQHKKDRFPVLYMQDGQNLFDRESATYGHIWHMHTRIEKLIKDRAMTGIIVVGIDCKPGDQRLHEYSPWPCADPRAMGYDHGVGGQGESYGRFLVDHLKPMIDKRYRTKAHSDHTAIGGSSMGALMALYLGATYPQVFSKVLAMSTAAWFAPQDLKACLSQIEPCQASRWYIDVGDQEVEDPTFRQAYIKTCQDVYETLKTCGLDENMLTYKLAVGGIHHEDSWAHRLPLALKWLFND